jgi:hypothetical protein
MIAMKGVRQGKSDRRKQRRYHGQRFNPIRDIFRYG